MYKPFIKCWSIQETVHMWWATIFNLSFHSIDLNRSICVNFSFFPHFQCSSLGFSLPQRAQTEAVTFLSNKESTRNLYAIPGLDYVSHDDVMPYSVWNRDRKPLRHELFDKFLVHTGKNDVSFKASETLYAWQERNHTFLELTEVHREVTEDIRVTVIPFYVSFYRFYSSMNKNALKSDFNPFDWSNYFRWKNNFHFSNAFRWVFGKHLEIQCIG